MNDNWVEIEVFVLLDENGDYVASDNIDKLADLYTEDITSGDDMARRIIRLKIKVEKPAEVELTGEAPLSGNGAKLVQIKGE